MNYTLSSALIMIGIIIIFYARFEKKTSRSRRLVIIAVMTALAVIGRAVFAVIPAFKPISAIIIITAIWLGPECGFMVGSLSILVSNFFFGQGPWTPFQMVAFGMLGAIAACFSGILKKSRIALSVYGAFAGIFYSCVMDIWTVLWFDNGFALNLYLAAIVTAVPYMILYSVSNIIFLLVLGKPFGDKLERVIKKYGI